jgi:hypothetical protein
MNSSERELNQEAFRRLRGVIDQTYPRGRFVAISGGQILADAETFDLVCSAIRAAGKEPTETLVVQAGADYLDYAVILGSSFDVLPAV